MLAVRVERPFPLTSIAVPNNLHTVHLNEAHFERALTRMRVLAKALCLLAIAATVATAKADTFKLTGDGDTYTFSIDSSPTVTPISFGFIVNGVTVTDDGVAQPGFTLTFYDTSSQGGFAVQSSNLIFDGDQLFSGTNDSPTFLLGTFKLTNDIDGSKYKLVIKDDPSTSPAPEPSSIVLLASGSLALIGAAHRKLLSR